MKKLKVRIKSWLIIKIAKLRKENKRLKENLQELIEKEHKYIDEMNILRNEIRELKFERKQYERYIDKKK